MKTNIMSSLKNQILKTKNVISGSTVGLSGYYVPEDTVSHISRRSIRTNRSKSASIADLTGKPNYVGRQTTLGQPGKTSDIKDLNYLQKNESV
jgi:hypothetical protein